MTDVAYEILADLVKEYAVQQTRTRNNAWETWYRFEGNMDGAMARAFAAIVGAGMAEWKSEKCIKFLDLPDAEPAASDAHDVLAVAHDARPPAHVCAVCGASCETQQKLAAHMRWKHQTKGK